MWFRARDSCRLLYEPPQLVFGHGTCLCQLSRPSFIRVLRQSVLIRDSHNNIGELKYPIFNAFSLDRCY